MRIFEGSKCVSVKIFTNTTKQNSLTQRQRAMANRTRNLWQIQVAFLKISQKASNFQQSYYVVSIQNGVEISI